MPSIYQCIWHVCKLVAANLSLNQHHSHKINVMVFVYSLYVSMCFSKTYLYSNISIARQIYFTNDTIWSLILLAWQSVLISGIQLRVIVQWQIGIDEICVPQIIMIILNTVMIQSNIFYPHRLISIFLTLILIYMRGCRLVVWSIMVMGTEMP